jgi:hypothetical protein
MVAAGGANMTHQKEGTSERDQHDSTETNGQAVADQRQVSYYPFSFKTFSAFLLTLD